MNIEDRIREAMRAHEHDAPTAAEFSLSPRAASGPPNRRTAWFAAAAAAACVLVVAAVVAIVNRPGDSPPPAAGPGLDCPQRYAATSPGGVAGPPTIADFGRRLVPAQTPRRVVVCAYLPRAEQTREVATTLTGSRDLKGDLAAVRTTLTWLPGGGQDRPCATYWAQSDAENYLIGLRYGGGTVWVSVPGNHCDVASNGKFTTTVNLQPWASAAYEAGTWVPDPPQRLPAATDGDPCNGQTLGRLGQESALVPPGAASVQICVALASSPRPRYRTVTTAVGVAELARALDRLPTQESTSSCLGDGHRQRPYELVFRYADGPAVHVRVDAHCRPAIDNGSRQAVGTGSVVPLIEQALARR